MKISTYLKKPQSIFLSLLQHFGWWIPDKLYLKWIYWLKLGRKLDLKSPKRFTEKLQWLKLYDRKPFYAKLVDKAEVKDYVAGIIGDEYIIPTLGVWNKPEDIDWDNLPDRFILKTTHGGGGSGVVICNDKSRLDKIKAIDKLNRNMKQDIYGTLREWPYKDIPRRVIAEQLLDKDSQYDDIPDYKFYCFNGIPKVVLIATNRFTDHNFNYYDMEFKKLSITSSAGSNAAIEFNKPSHFEEMKDIALKLSQGFAHIRVDLYSSNDRIYFGELTFYDSSGFDNLSSDSTDLEWGSWITLPNKNQYEKSNKC